jgi:hypothetical protein
MTNGEGLDTVSSVLDHLRVKSQDNEFVVNANGQISIKDKLYQQHEIKMIRTYRFEGESDPADEAIIYLIEANDGMIGYSLDAYGVYTNHVNDAYTDSIHKMANCNS